MAASTTEADVAVIESFFKGFLDRIPSDAYFSKAFLTKDHENDDKISASRKKKLNKRKRLDPAQMKTTSEMLNEQASAEEDDSDSDVPVGEDEETAWSVEKLEPQQSASLQELHKKFQAKLDAIKAQRVGKKRSPEEQLEVQKRRKAERARYKEKKKRKLNPNYVKKEKKAPIASDGKKSDESKPAASSKQNGEKMVFSKFEFTTNGSGGGSAGGITDSPATRRRDSRKRKTEQLLRIAEKKKAKMAELKESDPGKHEKVAEQEDWKKAMIKATGVKVKDDVKLLKKTIKRRENQKKQSRDKWAERGKKVEERQKAKQDRRQRNIQKKKDNKSGGGGGAKKGGKKKTPGF